MQSRIDEIHAGGAVVLAICKDPVEDNARTVENLKLDFSILSDPKITETYARRLQLGFLKMFERGETFEATAENQQQAAAKLKLQIEDTISKEQATLQLARDEYDRVSERGLRLGPQIAAREKQVVVLRDLARQLEGFRDVSEAPDEDGSSR